MSLAISETAKCRKATLCELRTVSDNYDALVEMCQRCSKKVVYGKYFTIAWSEDGSWEKRYEDRVDEPKYVRDHLRDTLQPYGPTGKLYEQIYGLKVVKETEALFKGRKSKKQIQDEWETTRREANDFVKKRVLGGYVRGTTD